MKRRESREAALIAIYEKTINGNSIDEIFESAEEAGTYKGDDFSKKLCETVFEHLEEIDIAIKSKLNRRVIERVPALPLSILRLSCAEMMFVDEVPDNISINEAVTLAKKYCDEDYVYINGILGSVYMELNGDDAVVTDENEPEEESDATADSCNAADELHPEDSGETLPLDKEAE